MKKLRWAMDGDFWDLDVSTPKTIDGLALPVPDDPLPLGVSRGLRLSRPRQIDFMQRFMAAPFVPTYSGDPTRGGTGFSLQRVLSLSLGDNWFAAFLGQFNLQKFVSSVKKEDPVPEPDSSLLQEITRKLRCKSLYALNLCLEILLTPDDTLYVSSEESFDKRMSRRKAVFHHKFPDQNLTMEAVWPALFVDSCGNYWDVPFSMAIDLASIPSDSGPSYHLSLHHNEGLPKRFDGDEATPGNEVPSTLLPGSALKGAFAFKKNISLWRSKGPKLKEVQPYDVFLSNPHVSASGTIGATMTASIGDNSVRSQLEDSSQDLKGLYLRVPGMKSALSADIFASVSFTAQHGNFQRRFLDLTRFHARLDFLSGSQALAGAIQLTQDLLNSQPPSLEKFQAVCPDATLSFQQQIAGPFSFRVDSRVAVDLKNRASPVRVDEPVFAIEYALWVIGSAKAIAWYSPKHQELMMELRFFET